jgi:hypothetical protein
MFKRTALEMLIEEGVITPTPDLMPVIADDAAEWHDRVIDQGTLVTDLITSLRIRPADIARSLKSLSSSPNAVGAVLLVAGPGRHVFAGSFLAGCDTDWFRSDEQYHMIAPQNPTLDLNIWATITCHILGLLHVKNAELVDRVVPRGDRRRAQKAGEPLIQVKELVIAPMRRVLQQMREHEAEHPGQPLPLHLCRGHFKTFTAKRPLLGKHVGTFWWEPHLRGSEQAGIIVHDRGRIDLP